MVDKSRRREEGLDRLKDCRKQRERHTFRQTDIQDRVVLLARQQVIYGRCHIFSLPISILQTC